MLFWAIIAADKLRENWKMNGKMQVYLMKNKDKGKKKHTSLWLHNLDNFLLSSHSSSFVLVCFVYSLGIYFKVKSSFWYYDLITSPYFVVNINIYTFVLSLCIKIWHITFWSFSYHLCHQIIETKNKDGLKKSLVNTFSVFIFIILGSTHYFVQ